MKVQILRGYRGKASGERFLAKGEHDLEPGLAKYLVNNGHATYIESEPTPATQPTFTIPSNIDRGVVLSVFNDMLDEVGMSERSHIPKAEQVKRELQSVEAVEVDEGIKFNPYTATKAELQETLDLVGVEYSTRDNKDTLIDLYENAPRKS